MPSRASPCMKSVCNDLLRTNNLEQQSSRHPGSDCRMSESVHASGAVSGLWSTATMAVCNAHACRAAARSSDSAESRRAHGGPLAAISAQGERVWTSGGVKEQPTLRLWSHRGGARFSVPLSDVGRLLSKPWCTQWLCWGHMAGSESVSCCCRMYRPAHAGSFSTRSA